MIISEYQKCVRQLSALVRKETVKPSIRKKQAFHLTVVVKLLKQSNPPP